jgi:hypothetical protein
MAASERVFGTVELLEAVLLEVPPRHLLISAQRVRTKWHDTIKTSTHLQRKLFYKHLKPSPKRNPILNPLLNDVLRTCDAEAQLGTLVWGTSVFCLRGAKGKKGYKKLPDKPKTVKKCSWEDMYPTSEPCFVDLRALGGPLTRKRAKLGTVMKGANKFALDKEEFEKGFWEKLLDRVRIMR